MTLAEARALENAERAKSAEIVSRHIAAYARAVDAARPAAELAARRRLFTFSCEGCLVREARAFTGAYLPA